MKNGALGKTPQSIPVQVDADLGEPRLKIPAGIITGNIFDHLKPSVLVKIICLYRIGAEGQTQAIEAFSVLVDVLVDHTPCTPLHLHIQSNRKLVHSILPKK